MEFLRSLHVGSRTLALLSACLIGTALPGCRPAAAPPVRIVLSFWGDFAEIEAILDSVAEFERAHPHIRVQADHSYRNAHDVLMLDRTGDGPDVTFLEVNDFVTFPHKADLLLDLGPFLAQDRKLDLGGYYPQIVREFSSGGKQYVLPRDIASISCLYYNRSLFQQAKLPFPNDDWSWPADLLPVLERLTLRDAQGNVQRYGLADDGLWQAYVLSNGGAYVDDPERPSRIALDTPASLAAIAFRGELVRRGLVPPDQRSSGKDLFMEGQAAMFLSGMWGTPYLRANLDFDWDIVLFPRGPDGPRRFYGGGSGYGILRSSRHPEAAWLLVKHLAGEPGQTALARAGVAQPALRELARSLVSGVGEKPRNAPAWLRAADQVVYYPHVAGWYDFLNSEWSQGLHAVWTGSAPAASALPPLLRRASGKLFPASRRSRL